MAKQQKIEKAKMRKIADEERRSKCPTISAKSKNISDKEYTQVPVFQRLYKAKKNQRSNNVKDILTEMAVGISPAKAEAETAESSITFHPKILEKS